MLSSDCLAYVLRWRRVALNMPHLWADVDVGTIWSGHCDVVQAHKEDYNIRPVQLWLARGGSVPRSLYVKCSFIYSLKIASLSQHHCPFRIQEIIGSFPYRELCLQLYWKEMALALRGIAPKQMLPLESLNLESNRPDRNSSLHLPLPTKLPNLTYLSLGEHFQGNVDKLITAVPWNQLEHLKLFFPIPSTTCFGVILSQGLSLTHCHLESATNSSFAKLHITEPVVMPQMKFLDVYCLDEVDVENFKRWVVVPVAVGQLIVTYIR